MQYAGVHPDGTDIMVPKGDFRVIYVKDLKSPAAAALKQAMLSAGAECAVNSGVITCDVERSDAVIMATAAQLSRAKDSLRKQPWGLHKLAEYLDKMLLNGNCPSEFAGISLDKPVLMGVLNVTPDSFSDGGDFVNVDAAVRRAYEMSDQGALIIDIGGESSRPGSSPVSENEEAERILPVIERITPDLAVSVDTRRAGVARMAVRAGARIINDISAGNSEPEIATVAKESDAGLILMHMKGIPVDMQDDPYYEDVIGEVRDYLLERAEWAESEGVESVAIDPGIGFGKTLQHNLSLLGAIPALKDVGYPVVIGHSRKSFIGNLLDLEVDDRLVPSVVAAVKAVSLGADIIRTHDVVETAQGLEIYEAIDNAEL
jgi:dihydropteroate synthase